MSRRRVDVRIDELVLRGVAPSDRDGIAEGLRTELARLVGQDAAGGAFAQGRFTEDLRVGEIHVRPNEPAGRVGNQLARLVAQGVR